MHIVGPLWNDGWFRTLGGELSEQQQSIRYEFVTLLVDRLLQLGFTEIVNYTLDEPSIAKATSPDMVDWISRTKTFDPGLKVHMTINHYAPELFETVNSYMDRWTPTGHVLLTLLEDAGKGMISIDEEDEIGFYGGGWYSNIADPIRITGWVSCL